MATAELVKTDFERDLEHLIQLKTAVAELLRPAAAKYLEFAREYWRLYTTVRGERRLVERLQLTLGVSEDHQHQRLRRIAEQATVLLPLRDALPAAVEPLYEVALVAAREGGVKRLRDAVKRDVLTPESGIREIRALKQRSAGKARKGRVKKSAGAQVVRIEISQASEPLIAQALAALLESDPAAMVRIDSQSLVDATKAELSARHRMKTNGAGVPVEPDVRWHVASAFRQLDKGEKVSGTRADDVTKNAEHPFHSSGIPNVALAARLREHAEQQRWLVPEIGLTHDHYVPGLASIQRRITKR